MAQSTVQIGSPTKVTVIAKPRDPILPAINGLKEIVIHVTS